jgi:diketogulonate reductase-like aldo/keto reductase
MQHEYAVLAKSTNPERIQNNIDIEDFSFEISEEDMESWKKEPQRSWDSFPVND